MESAALSEQSTLKTGLPPLHPISTQESMWEGRALPRCSGEFWGGWWSEAVSKGTNATLGWGDAG